MYKHPDQAALMNLANIEIPSAPIVVMSATDPDSYGRFTDYELKVLFNNICGMRHDGFNRNVLIQSVVRLVGMLSETQLRASEVDAQLSCIKVPGEECYKYIYGSIAPAEQPDLFRPNALVSVPGHAPADKKYFVRPENKLHKLVDKVGVNPFLPPEAVPTPRDPNAPREVSARPKEGSTTARVWEISDACYVQHPHCDKQLRALVAAECEKQGINGSTMSVQFSKWKHSKTAS